MSKKLYAIIEKDVRQLVHSKSSALIILVSPIILMLLAGFALSSSGLSGVKVGIYAPDTSFIKDTLDTKMQDKGFAISYFDTLDACRSSVKNELTHICVEVAKKDDPNLARIDPRLTSRINFYVDYSKVRLVWAIVNSIRTIVAQESTKITAEMTGKITNNIDEAINQIEANKGYIDDLINDIQNTGYGINNAKSSLDIMDTVADTMDSDSKGLYDDLLIIDAGMTAISLELIDFCNDILSTASSLPRPYYTSLNTQCVDMRTAVQESKTSVMTARNSIDQIRFQMTTSVKTLNSQTDKILTALDNTKNQLDQSINDLEDLKDEVLKVTEDISWVKDVKAQDIINPIPVNILPLSGEVTAVGSVSSALTYLDYLLPALLILVVMFVSTLISSTMVIKERKSHAYFRNIISPTIGVLFVLGVYFIGLILVGLQAALLVGVAMFFFGIGVTSYISIAIILTLTISIFVMIGIIIGYLFNSEETTMMGAISLALIFLLFSTLIIPLETMPLFMRGVAQLSPFIISEVALRKTMIFDIPLYGCLREIIKLGIILAIAFAAALVMQHIKKKREV